MDKILLNKLLDAYNRHGSIIVGVDFDDTIFPFNKVKESVDRCAEVVEVLVSLRTHIGQDLILCLYSVADAQSLVYKEHIMELYGIKPDYINEGPVDGKWENSKKPFFNILLDDKSGLDCALSTLTQFRKEID